MTPLDSLEDSEPSEPLSSSESKESSLLSLEITLTSESIANNPEYQNISEFHDVFDQPSESEFVTIDRIPMSHQE